MQVRQPMLSPVARMCEARTQMRRSPCRARSYRCVGARQRHGMTVSSAHRRGDVILTAPRIAAPCTSRRLDDALTQLLRQIHPVIRLDREEIAKELRLVFARWMRKRQRVVAQLLLIDDSV